jgi:4-amino-4-deoxy-L-arabinose transferase-like glycosyltransferase
VVLLLACVLHFCVGAVVGLSVDEAHYALYATHLALSYFDHPPLVGWIQWPLISLNAPTAVLRLMPELLWLATALVVHRIAERLNADTGSTTSAAQAGFWAVLAVALAPLLHVLGIGLLPDTLLMCLGASMMGLTLHLMRADALQRPVPWIALGLLLGLAGLSKYTAIFFALACGLCLLLAHGWRLLGNRWLWLAIVLALVLVSPVAVWNYQNHWVSFVYQARHGAGGEWQALQVLRFLLLQVLAFGPLLLWGWHGIWQAPAGSPQSPQRYLRLFFALPFGALTLMAGGGISLPHWTAPAWVALAPFAGLGLARAWHSGQRWLVLLLVAAQALACAALLALMVSGGVPLAQGVTGQGTLAEPSNPFADVHGWDAAGARARDLAAQNGLPSVSVQSWTLASRLGWYARPLPVHVLEDRFDQFNLWAGELPRGAATLLVDWSQLGYQVPLGDHGFTECSLLESQQVQRLGVAIATFGFYACHGWSGQPRPKLTGVP